MTTLLPEPVRTVPPAPPRSWTGREQLHRYRGAVAVTVAAVLVVLLAVLTRGSSGTHGQLDPRSYDPNGARALATLLAGRGVEVHRVINVAGVLAEVRPGETVFVADPAAEPDLTPLRGLPGSTTIVLAAADPGSLGAIGSGIERAGHLSSRVRDVDCSLPEARVAGAVDGGGDGYGQAPGNQSTTAISCYSGLVYEQSLPSGGGLVAIGSGDLLSNDELDRAGNAALGIGLLSRHQTVLWLVPGPVAAETGGQTPLGQLLPARLGWAFLQLVIAVALLMLWRARRLGRVVDEPLPVVVRAGETVEGLGRLYLAAGARGRAGASLRAAAVRRLAPRLGLARTDGRAAVVDAVAARTGRPPADVDALLYGPEPEDDVALVRLAARLDALEAEVRRT